MPGEPILIVDDTPVNLKLTRIILVNEGYKVLTAASAEEAIELLRGFHPDLVLADIQLPGIDGLELTRRIKRDENTRDIAVVALTAFATQGDEQKAIDAGCDGYITKPIDTRALGARIRAFLDRRAESMAGLAPPASPDPASPDKIAIPAADLLVLRRRFLDEGREQARQWLLDLDGQFDANEAARVVHQWIGAGGLLGYTAISRLAREVAAILLERPLDQTQLRESLANLAMAFTSPRDARDAAVPESVVEALSGKRIALVGLPVNEAQRLSVALERSEAEVVFFAPAEQPNAEEVQACHAVVVHVRPETAGCAWLDSSSPLGGYRPLVLAGSRESLLALDQAVQSMATEFLMDSWEPEEALVRLCHSVSARQIAAAPSTGGNNAPLGRTTVLLADDDPTVLTLVRAAIKNFGMECYTAAEGRSALETIRRIRPNLAVLDVNMPGMDGYEVLAAIRADKIPVRVMLLTARQQESDVIRGFMLGADDYVVKPFSPMELMARLKRLLSR
ncbi:Response regulator receiver protein [Candidatus Sulfopaludibacter sp. SbA6]|nr:Response regulator receiver protein [Candidatus Sulfopaludibacter sp. SbA6]